MSSLAPSISVVHETQMHKHRDIGGLASAAWFNFRATQFRPVGDTVFTTDYPNSTQLPPRRVGDTVFITDYPQNPNNTIVDIKTRHTSLKSDLDRMKAYRSALKLQDAQIKYLHARYTKYFPDPDMEARMLESKNAEIDMMNSRHTAYQLTRQRCDAECDVKILELAVRWADSVYQHREITAVAY